MLLRHEAEGTVLAIAQPAHAALAGRLAEAWGEPLPADLVQATHHHDDVWAARDAVPLLDPGTGLPQTHLALPSQERAALWSRAAEVAAPLGPRAELWVLRHAHRLHVEEEEPEINAMVAGFGARIAELLPVVREGTARFDDAELARGSALLGLLDTLALHACSGVGDRVSAGVTSLAPGDDGAISVAPWPFSGPRVESFVEARRLPGALGSQAELDAAWAAAEPFAFPIVLVTPG